MANMNTEILNETLAIQNNSYFIRAKKSLQTVIGACYLNLFLNENGIYNKNFTTMTDNDFVEYNGILERLHNIK